MMNNKSITTVSATININNPEYKIRRNSNYLFIDNNVINIDNMKEILDEHREDRKAFTESIQMLAKRQDKIEDTVDDIKIDVKKIMEKI